MSSELDRRPTYRFPLAPIRGGSRKWSHIDPEATVNGKKLKIKLEAWAEDPDHNFSNFIIGPVRLDIGVPIGSSRSILLVDAGWGTGYDIHWYEDGSMATGTNSRGTYTDAEVRATIAANFDVPSGHDWDLRMTLTPVDTDYGDKVEEFRSNNASDNVRIRF